MKITTYQQLDELVAKELGWVYHVDSEDWYEGEGIMLLQNKGWVPPEYTNNISYCFNNLKDKERVPYYSTNLEDMYSLIKSAVAKDSTLRFYIIYMESESECQITKWNKPLGKTINSYGWQLPNSLPLIVVITYLEQVARHNLDVKLEESK